MVSFESVAGLPREFLHQPAVAIPCRLYGAMPLYDDGSAIWTMDDRVHEEFQRLTTNLIECTIVDLKENLFYDIAIHLPSKFIHYLTDSLIVSLGEKKRSEENISI